MRHAGVDGHLELLAKRPVTSHSSAEVITQLERLLSLPVGSLTSLLPSDLASRWDPVRAVPYTDQALALLQTMGLDPTSGYSSVTFHETTRVSADHTHQFETTRQLIRCEREGLDRLAMVMRQNFLDDPTPLVRPQEGCTLGRVVQLDNEGLLAVELVLDRALCLGDLYRLNYLVIEQMPADVTESGYTRVLPAPVEYLVLDVIFEQHEPPRVQYRTTPRAYDPDAGDDVLTQDLPRGRFVQIAVTDASAGMHELAWDY